MRSETRRRDGTGMFVRVLTINDARDLNLSRSRSAFSFVLYRSQGLAYASVKNSSDGATA